MYSDILGLKKQFRHYYVDEHNIFNYKQIKIDQKLQKKEVNNIKEYCNIWLKFIALFWSKRVAIAAMKLIFTSFVMHRHERLGFLVMVICFTF